MKNTILFIALIHLAVFPSVAFATCTHAVGDIVKMLSPVAVAEQMSNYRVLKDEFETNKEFRARQKMALENLPDGTMIVEAVYDPEYAIYNADTAKFLIKESAWNNTYGYFDVTIPAFKVDDSNLRAIGLQHINKIIETYKASNTYNKEVEVVKILRKAYGIFDIFGDFTLLRGGDISLSIPREQARILKTEMRIGIGFTPKTPFLSQGEDHYKATIDLPLEVVLEANSIIGKLECVVITDAKGTVLKVVGTAH